MRTTISKEIRFLCTLAALSILTSPGFSQSTVDTTDGRFYDDLLDNLVGKWEASATVHKAKFTLRFDVDWVLNHQYLRVHFISNEIVPWLKVPFESQSFFGYDRMKKRYTFHELTVHGDSGPYEEALSGADRTGDEFLLVKKQADADRVIVQIFSWNPDSGTWRIVSRLLEGEIMGEPFLQMDLHRVK